MRLKAKKKITKCLKNNHDEKLLDTYQSERFSNVKEYIETTMRMGEFVNAVGSTKITDNISLDTDGTESMKSIKPQLGAGLGKKKDQNRGKIFPQFKLKNGKNLDEKFSNKPLLIVSSNIKKKISSKLNYINSINVNGLCEYLENISSCALIVRPDRFILQSCKSAKDFQKFIDFFNKF